MSDPTTPPAGTATTADTPKPRRASTGINREIADELDRTEQLYKLTFLPDYTAALADEGIDSAFQKKLGENIDAADNLIGIAVGDTADKETITLEEETKKKALLAAIAVVQKRAKRKYKNTEDPARDKYFIHMKIGANRALLESSASAILKTLATDTLPAGKPTDATNIDTALKDYIGIQTDQSKEKSEAMKARVQLEALMKDITAARLDIQYAVDTLWPASDKANAPVRLLFKLSATKSMR